MEPNNEHAVVYRGENGGRSNSIRIGLVVAIALAAAIVAWIVVDRTGNDSSTSTPNTTAASTTGSVAVSSVGPVVLSQSALSAQAAALGHPVYSAGAINGHVYEYTLTSAGSAYIRYLPKGARAGDKRAEFLIIATYPFPKAYAALTKVGKGRLVKMPGGGGALVAGGYPQSVHFAFPFVDYQGEVYDPSPERALAVATSGDVQPVP